MCAGTASFDGNGLASTLNLCLKYNMTTANILPRVHIGEVVRNAVLFNPENSREHAVNADLLIETVAHFFSLLREREIEHVLVGGIALLQYVEGRNTEDIDLIMTSSSLERIPELVVESPDEDFARGNFGDLRVDVLLTSNPLFNEVRQRYTTTQQFIERDIPCATVEGLILLKLYAMPSLYRQGNFVRVGLYENDVATLLQAHNPPIKPLLDELSHHLSEADTQEVRQIVTEIQQRISRFEKRK